MIEEPLVKATKRGERTCYRWVAAWRVDGKHKKVYLGSCKKMSRAETLQRARWMKAAMLGLRVAVE